MCSQDCDLVNADIGSTGTIVEIRPVLNENSPESWGIRSSKLRLNDRDYVDASKPRAFITAAQLAKYDEAREPLPSGHRLRALKTWLGRRYDRPALPPHLVNIAREVAKRCEFKAGRPTAKMIHDVLMQVNEEEHPPRVALYAVITDDADVEAVREWLANASQRINPDLGVVEVIRTITRAQTSLHLIETSYSADLSQLTWRDEAPSGAE